MFHTVAGSGQMVDHTTKKNEKIKKNNKEEGVYRVACASFAAAFNIGTFSPFSLYAFFISYCKYLTWEESDLMSARLENRFQADLTPHTNVEFNSNTRFHVLFRLQTILPITDGYTKRIIFDQPVRMLLQIAIAQHAFQNTMHFNAQHFFFFFLMRKKKPNRFIHVLWEHLKRFRALVQCCWSLKTTRDIQHNLWPQTDGCICGQLGVFP